MQTKEATGIAIGVVLGVAIGAAMDNIAMGIGIGIALAIAKSISMKATVRRPEGTSANPVPDEHRQQTVTGCRGRPSRQP
jgi:hypothetical protein